MNRLVMKCFPEVLHSDAYAKAEVLLREGRKAPFPEAGYYSDITNEPLHFLVDGQLVGVATLLIHGPTFGEVYKLYVHPAARELGLGKRAAQRAIDYLFDKYSLEEVGVDMHGDSHEFWFKMVQEYCDRALWTESRCYFLKQGLLARDRYPWAVEMGYLA